MISQGDVWWADLREPTSSAPGYRRPVIVIQGETFNRSTLSTVVCVPLTSNLGWADAPGNVRLSGRTTGLERESVANVSQVLTVDRSVLTQHVGQVPAKKMDLILSGIDIVLGRA